MSEHNKCNYFPIIRARGAELKGYKELSDEKKDVITPVMSLGKWRGSEGYEKGLQKIQECVGKRNFILDITNDIQHQNLSIRELLDPRENFRNWVSLVESMEFVAPVVQFSNEAKSREIVRQAMSIEAAGKSPVFRIKNFKSDLSHTLNSLYALDKPEKASIIIDASYIRDLSTKSLKAGTLESILRTLNTIIEELPEVPRILSGTSFPRSVTPFLDEVSNTSGKIGILENLLFDEIGKDIVAYSDHASIHSVVYDDMGGTYLPRIDVPSDGFWHFQRRPGTKSPGYIDAAQSILLEHPHFSEEASWGAEMIRNTANETKQEIITTPVTAVAVRVNLHLNYQIDLMSSGYTEVEEDW